MSTSSKCPHCDQEPAKSAWPFCSWCGLFVIDIEELNLSPEALLSAWRVDRKLVDKILQ